ncbi:MAG: tetraacyldisaccharide 4'-kinase [Acidobacteria bacterium]|nr:MAG: tetraacyldisaccharide 4'-kinase [Acidobacteriota bacterium]
MLNSASRLYGAAARARRAWYARHPESTRRLCRPVISVGNVAVGGSGKTPVVARLARMLLEAGERPSVLSRGYARRRSEDGVTVVSDGCRVLADVDRAGDEPLMLARALPAVPVLVGADRYLGGVLAERRFGCTVHLLDDGFQHFALARDLDLVIVSPEDVERPVTLPAGRLREPLDAARAAHALIVAGTREEETAAVAAKVGVEKVFRLRRSLGRARLAEPARDLLTPAEGTRVLAVAAVARPQGFFTALAVEGWTLAGQMAFADHHRFTQADVHRVLAAMHDARAGMVVTTEKDLVRLQPLEPLPFPVAVVPLEVSIEPEDEFRAWVLDRLRASGIENGELRMEN